MNDRIVTLKGPERIRRRPAVIFGSEHIEGVQAAISRLLDIYVSEAQLGHCRQLTVVHNGAEVEMQGDDRGIYLGQDTGDDSVWKQLFCEFSTLPAYLPDEKDYSFSLMDQAHCILYGDEVDPKSTFFPDKQTYLDLCWAQYASKFMDVTCVRNGIKSTLHFEKGHNIGGIRNEPTDESNGTTLHLAMDGEVFTQTEIPSSFFLNTLERFAMLVPGLECKYIHAESGGQTVFSYPNGLTDYARKKSMCTAADIYSKRITAKGRDRYDRAEYEACVELAISPALHAGSTLCLHNFQELTSGGTHLKKIQTQVCSAFNTRFLSQLIDCEPEDPVKYAKLREKHALTFDELSKHLTIVLASWCSPHCSAWENGSRKSIRNIMITDMACDVAAHDLSDYVYENADALAPIIEAIRKERKRSISRLFHRLRNILFPEK